MTDTKTAIIFGMNASVCSWICVVAWKILTSNPTANAINSKGAAINIVVNTARSANVRTKSGVTYNHLLVLEKFATDN